MRKRRSLQAATAGQINSNIEDLTDARHRTELQRQSSHQPASMPHAHQQNRILSGKQQQVEKLQHQVRNLQHQFGLLAEDQQQRHAHASRSFSKARRSLLQDTAHSSTEALQKALAAAEQQIATQAELVSSLQLEVVKADRQLEKVTNLLESQQDHARRLEEQLDSKADSAKTRFAKLSQHLEAERRTVKTLRTKLQSLTASSESQVSRLATELEAKQGLLRGLQSTVQSAKADAESSKHQAEAASSALTGLKDAGVDLERLSAQLSRERQVRFRSARQAQHETYSISSISIAWVNSAFHHCSSQQMMNV